MFKDNEDSLPEEKIFVAPGPDETCPFFIVFFAVLRLMSLLSWMRADLVIFFIIEMTLLPALVQRRGGSRRKTRYNPFGRM